MSSAVITMTFGFPGWACGRSPRIGVSRVGRRAIRSSTTPGPRAAAPPRRVRRLICVDSSATPERCATGSAIAAQLRHEGVTPASRSRAQGGGSGWEICRFGPAGHISTAADIHGYCTTEVRRCSAEIGRVDEAGPLYIHLRDEGVAGAVVAPAERAAFFFQAEDGIRDLTVTGVQTCALPI